MATRHVKESRPNTNLYEYKEPTDLFSFHVIVKLPSENSTGMMSHAFVFAENAGAATNAVVAFLGLNRDPEILAEVQITCKHAKHVGGGVYQM